MAMTMRLYLKSGAVIEFQIADGEQISWQEKDGKLTKINYAGATGDVPRYLDLDHVVAITREVKG